VPGGPRATLPWFLVTASALLAALLAYTLFAGYLPAKQRIGRLERELKDLYAREAELQTKLAQTEQRHAARERQLSSVTTERDAIARRLDELERELAVARGRRR
jgi:septal ring factor EnvC (AmiA/AmiB activator)